MAAPPQHIKRPHAVRRKFPLENFLIEQAIQALGEAAGLGVRAGDFAFGHGPDVWEIPRVVRMIAIMPDFVRVDDDPKLGGARFSIWLPDAGA